MPPVPVGAGLVGARRGEDRALAPRAPHELEARREAALAEAVRYGDGGEPGDVPHGAHHVANRAPERAPELLVDPRGHLEAAGGDQGVQPGEDPRDLPGDDAAEPEGPEV